MTPLILIVEDQPLHAKLFSDILRGGGFNAITLGNGRDVAATAAATRPDVILLDILLPDVDGREVIATLRAHQDVGATSILAISASADREMADDCLAAGADAFLSKPVGMRELIQRITGLLPG